MKKLETINWKTSKQTNEQIYKSYESEILRKFFKPNKNFLKMYQNFNVSSNQHNKNTLNMNQHDNSPSNQHKNQQNLINQDNNLDYFNTVYCISTGSQAGNSYVISSPTENYLIDYGLSQSKIKQFLANHQLKIKNSFYSHQHQDHYKSSIYKIYSELKLTNLMKMSGNSVETPISFPLIHTNAQYKGSKHHLGLEHIENRGLIFKNLIYITDTGVVDDEIIKKINTLDFSKYPYVILMIENNYCFHSVMDNFNGDEAMVLKRSLADDGHMSCLGMYATYVKLKIEKIKIIYLHGSSNKGKFDCPFEYEPYRARIGKIWKFDE